MGILDFLVKKKREIKMMKQKKVKKKKTDVKKVRGHLKKKPTKKYVTIKKQHPVRTQIKAMKHKDVLSLKEAKDTLIKLKTEIFNAVSLRNTEEDALQKEELFDEVDHTIEERQKQLSLLLNEREKAKLNEIDEALQRIENKSYGICEECGENISPERLKYLPYARLCVDCQGKLEKMQEEESGSHPELIKVGVPSGFSNTNDNEEM